MTSRPIIKDIAVRESGGDLLFLLPPTPYDKDAPTWWKFDLPSKSLMLFQDGKTIADTFIDDENAESFFSKAKSVIIIETDDENGIGGINQYSDVRKLNDS